MNFLLAEHNGFLGTFPSFLKALNSLDVLRMEGNDFTDPFSEADNVCGLSTFVADCLGNGDVEADFMCECCTSCCIDGGQCEKGNGKPPENDECESIEGPPLVVGSLEVVEGTILRAGWDNAPTCDGVNNLGKGVWYAIMGTGKNISASTCPPFGSASFNSQITVYHGSDCSNLQCVAANDDFCGSQSKVVWASKVDENYRILVHGSHENSDGMFQLVLSTV